MTDAIVDRVRIRKIFLREDSDFLRIDKGDEAHLKMTDEMFEYAQQNHSAGDDDNTTASGINTNDRRH